MIGTLYFPGDVGQLEAVVLDLSFANTAPIDWGDYEWQSLRAALTPSPCPGDGMLAEAVKPFADGCRAVIANYGADRPDHQWQTIMVPMSAVKALLAALTPSALSGDAGEAASLRAALEPFAAMGRVMETRARVTFGKMPKDSEIVCESSGEAGLGILTMGHFRDAAATLPNAPGWGGMYKPLPIRAAHQGAGEHG